MDLFVDLEESSRSIRDEAGGVVQLSDFVGFRQGPPGLLEFVEGARIGLAAPFDVILVGIVPVADGELEPLFASCARPCPRSWLRETPWPSDWLARRGLPQS